MSGMMISAPRVIPSATATVLSAFMASPCAVLQRCG
jgi:hypothetical protein